MSVEKAPYLEYTEVTSYMENTDNGSEIPVWVVKTNNTVYESDITPSKVFKCISYTAFKQKFSISEDEETYNSLPDSLKELNDIVKDFFKENSMYNMNGEYGLSVPYIYIVDVGNAPTIEHYKKALTSTESKRKTTVVSFPNTEDVKFMKEVKNKFMEETKSGLLRIGYFAVSGQGQLQTKFAKGYVVRPTLNYHGFTDLVNGYLINHTVNEEEVQVFSKTQTYDESQVIIGTANILYKDESNDKYYKYSNGSFVEIASSNLNGYGKVIEGYKNNNKFYTESVHENELTPYDETAIYINKSVTDSTDAYTYDSTSFVSINVIVDTSQSLLYESDEDYNFIKPSTKKEFGGTSETFAEYCERLTFICDEVNSSRVAIVEKEHIGKTVARICSTPYYVEPGYLPYMSVTTGVFQERSKDDRDLLFGTGLIFNEDDYTLGSPVSRICLGTSTAWGISDHDARTTDSLIHARRNVDYQVRRMINIIAPQLKRNETSVTLRYVKNQLDLYLDGELNDGKIQAYWVDVIESSYNPYELLIRGRITPVNSTLAIDFENTVGSPYAIASDYV